MTRCDYTGCPDPAETWCLVSGRAKRLCESHRRDACRRCEVVVAWEAPVEDPAPSFTNPTTDATAAPATTPTEEKTMPTPCRWPGCAHAALAYRFCARELKRVKSLGFTPSEVTDDQIPALVEAWDARQAARVLSSATSVGETPPGSWGTPAPFTTGAFAPPHSTAGDAPDHGWVSSPPTAIETPSPAAEAPAEGWAGPPPHAEETPSAEVDENPSPALVNLFGTLLFGAARLAGVTIEDGADTDPTVQAVLAGLRELNDRANQRGDLQAEVGRLTRDLAERTRDLEVVHGILQDAAPESYRGSPTTVIAHALTDQLATFRADLRAICTALDITVPAAALPILREWSAARTREAEAESVLRAIDDALQGCGIDTRVYAPLHGIEKLRSQRDAAQAQLDAGGPSPSSGLVLSPREVAAIGLALDAVLACDYDHKRSGVADVIRAIVGLPVGKAS